MTRYRGILIANGAIVPAGAAKPREASPRPVLRLDDRGRAQAATNIALGERGALLMEMPQGLGRWHEQAMERREKHERAAAARTAN